MGRTLVWLRIEKCELFGWKESRIGTSDKLCKSRLPRHIYHFLFAAVTVQQRRIAPGYIFSIPSLVHTLTVQYRAQPGGTERMYQ